VTEQSIAAFTQRIVVIGYSGFLCSYLCERLLAEGAEVICLDSFFTGAKTETRLASDRRWPFSCRACCDLFSLFFNYSQSLPATPRDMLATWRPLSAHMGA